MRRASRSRFESRATFWIASANWRAVDRRWTVRAARPHAIMNRSCGSSSSPSACQPVSATRSSARSAAAADTASTKTETYAPSTVPYFRVIGLRMRFENEEVHEGCGTGARMLASLSSAANDSHNTSIRVVLEALWQSDPPCAGSSRNGRVSAVSLPTIRTLLIQRPVVRIHPSQSRRPRA